jgi:glyoxylate reductase
MPDKDVANRVLMTQHAPEPAIKMLTEELGEDALSINPDLDRIWSKSELVEHLRGGGFSALYCMLTNRIDAEVLDAAPDLRIVANMAVGYNNIDVAECTRRGIPATNTPGVLTDTTADFAWALLMASARRVSEGERFLRAGKFHGWGPLMMVGHDVYGKTLGIIGFGRIGRAMAKRAQGFGMRVLYLDRTPAEPQTERELNARPAEMDELLSESDFVSLHTDYNPETHHLIGAEQLRKMKPTAYLINTARGAIVDEGALVDALRSRTIAGAGLDVFEKEPEIHPGLLELENAVLAPHIASASLDTRNAMATMAAENVLSALRGERPPNVVNPEVYD